MALQTGEHYRCPDPECGCEIEVTKGAAPGKGGAQPDSPIARFMTPPRLLHTSISSIAWPRV